MTIARGTTPTIFIKLHVVDPNDIVSAFLTIKQKSLVLEKDIETMHIGESMISWDLSQAETLSLKKGSCLVECRYRTTSQKAYKSKCVECGVEDVQKDGQI